MNRKTIQKVIDELKKENPDLSYLRGILEMLIETLPEGNGIVAQIGRALSEPVNLDVTGRKEKVVGSTPTSSLDESAMLDAKAKAALEVLKSMEQQNGQE